MLEAVPPKSPPVPGEFPETVGAGLDFSRPDSRFAKFYFETPHVLAVLIIFLIASLSSFIPLWHTDVWAHLRYGQWMLDHKTIPTEEPFSPWWDGSIPFTQFYTLSQTAMVLVYRAGAWLAGGDELNQMAGGVDALRTLHGLLHGIRLTLLWFAFRRLAGNISTPFSGLVFVILIDTVNISVFRPQVFAQVYFALLLFLFSNSLSWRIVLALPLFLAIWANTHGSFIVALTFLFLVFAGHVLERLNQLSALLRDPDTYKYLLALIGSFMAIGLLNPYGFNYYSRTLALTSHSALNLGIEEWQPLQFAWRSGWHWVLMISLMVTAVTLYRSSKPLAPAHWLLILVIGGGMALQQRFVIWWAMLLPWILVPHWANLQTRVEQAQGGEEPPASFRKTLLAAAVAISLLMWSTPVAWILYWSPTPLNKGGVTSGTPWELAQVLKHPDRPTSQSEWSSQLQRTIQTNYPGGRFTGSVFASPTQGDFLLWAIAPDIPVTYTHMHLFPPQLWAELGRVATGAPGWEDTLEKYGVNLLAFEPVLCPNLKRQLEKSPEWLILLDESESKEKLLMFNRQFFAIRVKPLKPTFQDLGGRKP